MKRQVVYEGPDNFMHTRSVSQIPKKVQFAIYKDTFTLVRLLRETKT